MHKAKSKKKDSIIKVEKELLEAMENGNIENLDILLHEGLLFNIPNGQTITKAMDLDTYRSGYMKINTVKASNQEINIIGDNAIVSVNIDMKGIYLDHAFNGTYKVIRVWKLFDKQWKVIAGSSIEQEKQ